MIVHAAQYSHQAAESLSRASLRSTYIMIMQRGAALLAVLTVGLLSTVDAGDYRNGRTRPLRDEATLSWNYEPVPTLARHQLPKVTCAGFN